MAALIWRLAGVGLLAALVAGGLWKAYDLGLDAGRAETAAALEQWKAAVQEQAIRRRQEQQARVDALQGENDELRNRPERIRTVTRTIRVEPDEECRSLPPSFRERWNQTLPP